MPLGGGGRALHSSSGTHIDGGGKGSAVFSASFQDPLGFGVQLVEQERGAFMGGFYGSVLEMVSLHSVAYLCICMENVVLLCTQRRGHGFSEQKASLCHKNPHTYLEGLQ